MTAPLRLRPYTGADEEVAIELWRRSWQHAYPDIDFSARLAWWRERWRNELVPGTRITLAEHGGALVGFVTIDPNTGYLDQIVVAPEAWGSGIADVLLAHARKQAPDGLDLHVNQDNARAVRFYEKNGFVKVGTDINATSKAPTYKMSWRP